MFSPTHRVERLSRYIDRGHPDRVITAAGGASRGVFKLGKELILHPR